jgi:hypothetical protein
MGRRRVSRHQMQSSRPVRILVVTDHPSATPELVEAIRKRVERGTAQFRVLVPNPAPAEWHPLHPERHTKAEEAEGILARALPDIARAAGASVTGTVSIRHDPMDAIEGVLFDEPFDEIIILQRPHGIMQLLHLDLSHRVAHLGLRVTTVGVDA